MKFETLPELTAVLVCAPAIIGIACGVLWLVIWD